MNYLSVCSGVEAATVAWHSLGWKPVGFSEIEKFPSAVLQHHYPQVTNYGDMTTYKEWDINESVGLLVGGTPCQSFSVAGLRKGLEDPRGNLALTYVGILDRFRPKWFIWENVPGVLSSNSGRDFGSFLGAVAECGYGFAYRVLDAQYFGVPQRRRRVFVVGCLGDWESAAKVLFEPDCLRGDTPPSREKRKETTRVATNRLVAFGEYSDDGTASTIKARDYKDHTDLIVYETHPADSRVKDMGDVCQTVTSRWGTGGGNVPLVQAYSLREDAKANNFSATPLHVTPALQALRPSVQSHHAQTFVVDRPVVGALCARDYRVRHHVDFGSKRPTCRWHSPSMLTLDLMKGVGNQYVAEGKCIVQNDMAVRRLTPVECERLQGFPDNYTQIPWGKGDTPDSHRYKAMGNSMAVPCMQWIGDRIQKVENGLL
jgi:DNA (cytosine-5)-methyltransferase 1